MQLLGIVIAVLVVVGGGAYYYQNGMNSSENKESAIELNDDEVVNPVHDDDAVEFENGSDEDTDEA